MFCDGRNECTNAITFIQESLAELQLNIPNLTDDGKTSVSGPSDIVEFLGVEIRRFDSTYKLCAPASKLTKISEDMAAMASFEKCVREKRNLGQVVRALDSFIIGHHASMSVLDRPDEFLERLESAKRKHLTALLISLLGEKAVEGLTKPKQAILGLMPFQS